MDFSELHFALGMDVHFVSPESENFKPKTWPPTSDCIVVTDHAGKVISRYGDPIWDLSPWAERRMNLNFRIISNLNTATSDACVDMAKLICAWWLWGPRSVNTAGTLNRRFTQLIPLFKLCARKNIEVSDLYRHPEVVDELHSGFSSSSAQSALILLHVLYEYRHAFGHTILDKEGLRRLANNISRHERSQTAYIPPRIWLYQVNRLKEFIDDYLVCADRVADCYNECISLYIDRFGSLDAIYESGERNIDEFSFSRNFEPFSYYAEKHNLLATVMKWTLKAGAPKEKLTILSLSSYMTLASRVGMAYLLNFSLMRVDEAWKLRIGCLDVENDPQFGAIYTLGGITTKTIQDSDARWVTSPSTQSAVTVLTHVATLKMNTALKRSSISIPKDLIEKPWLHLRQYEPWAPGTWSGEKFQTRPAYPSYLSLLKSNPVLFDLKELTITEPDLEYARLLTPSLGASYNVGKVWPLGWHQLRRTGAVNMQASGLVSDPSVQYQLKHATRSMSLYYGRGHSRVNLDPVAYATYVKTMYEVLSKEITRLMTPRFVSPYGESRKQNLLNIVSTSDAKKLASSARKGLVSWKETLAGGCVKRGHCSLGGADTLIHCGGGHGKGPCTEALFDKERVPELIVLQSVIEERMELAPLASPYHESLTLQHKAVSNILITLEEGAL
ncbi:hypothetical protein GHN92_07260 [Pseudomonas sp. FSL R10-2964]|uniref:hypothetical protein n=1 Tax=unclassified Pseudomonas TaxID=196821 RepID=UPI00129491BF|nr:MULTISPECIES: hypothetical protein [unclassified Pseudomonas]MQT61081.1 hypothetical protein [Pseudomonas sp. FSL R10-0399]MQT84364.1 hypothetical protein [Pseudomonas sp. FSL R10-2964]